MTNDRPDTTALETVQFRQFLYFLGFLLILFGGLAAAAGWRYGDWRYQDIALVIGGVLASVVAADVLIRRARPHVAVLVVSVGILAGIGLVAWIEPALYPTLVLSSLLPGAVLLLHRRSAGRSVVIFSWILAVAVAINGAFRHAESTPSVPEWFATGFLIASVAAAMGVALLLFWQSSRQLLARVDELDDAHARLIEERDLMDMLAAGIVDGVLTTDGDGRVKVLNASAERLTGWTRQEARNRDLGEIFDVDPPLVFPSDLHEASRAADGPVSADEPLSLISRDGVRRLVTMTAAPLRRSGTEYVGSVLVFRDVTDRIHREAMDATPLPNVMERLADRAAQEFRNLLTAMSGHVELLASTLLAPEASRHLQAIREASTRGTFLVRQLLGLHRRNMEPARTIDVSDALTALRPTLEALLSPDITLTVHQDSDLGSIVASPQAIDYTLLALIAGARDAMTEGGEVVIEASTVPSIDAKGEAQIAVWMMAHGEDANRPAVEAPFTYMSRGAPRPMPGLSVAETLARSSGGSLTADTYSPHCRVFTVRFPSVAHDVEPHVNAPHAGDLTVLLVEDDASVRAMLTETLRHDGYTVIAAATPSEAIERAQQHAGPIHAGLIDVNLPGVSGNRLAPRLEQLHPGLVVVFMSDAQGLDNARAGQAPHAGLEKPFLPTALLQLLRRVLRNTPPTDGTTN